jgi:hypothetical protein
VDGTIEIETLSNVVYVGRPVIARSQSEGTLFRLEPGGQFASQVKLRYGRASVNQMEIRSGLEPGDKVILSDMSTYAQQPRVRLR